MISIYLKRYSLIILFGVISILPVVASPQQKITMLMIPEYYEGSDDWCPDTNWGEDPMITIDGTGTYCPPAILSLYPGTTHIVKANPGPFYVGHSNFRIGEERLVFDHWLPNRPAEFTFTVPANDMTFTAVYRIERNIFTYNVKNGRLEITGGSAPDGWFREGEVATITAIPDQGYTFSYWNAGETAIDMGTNHWSDEDYGNRYENPQSWPPGYGWIQPVFVACEVSLGGFVEINDNIYSPGTGTPLQGVVISYEGIGSVTTNANGWYDKVVPCYWRGRLEPSHPDYTFTPPYRYISIYDEDFDEQFFIAHPKTALSLISGTVYSENGTGLNGVFLNFSNGAGSVVTDNGGTYQQNVAEGWSGTITPSLSGYGFTPPQINISKISSNISNQDFIAKYQQKPARVTLLYPQNGAGFVWPNVNIKWISAAGALTYRLQISLDPTFSSLISDLQSLSFNSQYLELEKNTTYYWRVSACNTYGCADWSEMRSFTTSGSSFITDLSSANCEMADVKLGDLYYTDKTYPVTFIPSSLENLLWIKTPYTDKDETSLQYLIFNLTRRCIIYVAYDWRVTQYPEWLTKQFTDSNLKIGVYDGTYFLNVWQCTFDAGQVILGGNMAYPAASARSNYVVLIKPLSYQISGRITAFSELGVNDITISFEGGTSVQTKNGGHYTLDIPAGWRGYVTPSDPRYQFTPIQRYYNVLSQDVNNQDYTATLLTEPPNADFIASATEAQTPASFSFSDLSTGSVDSWNWEFGDGTISHEKNPTHVYQKPGLYTVRLTVSASGQTATKTRENYISVTKPNQPSCITGLPDTTLSTNKEIIIPLIVSDLTGKGIFSYQFILTFDPDVIYFKEIRIGGTISATRSMPLVNSAVPGRIIAGSFDAYEFTGSGTLLYLVFEAIHPIIKSYSALHFESFILNAGDPPVEYSDGILRLTYSTSVQDNCQMPDKFQFSRAYPNPFNQNVCFSLSLTGITDVHISIFDRLGRKIKVIASASFNSGTHVFTWDGTDEYNFIMPSGTYFVLFEDSKNKVIKKLLLLR